jgi:(4-(4-[2-(gamma-L-glutamylamino)ethyl]phenoxymethyl)furan-2-yl)methanamine synthase
MIRKEFSSMQANSVIGWDVGGAHLKAALVDQHGNLIDVIQTACPLWKGLHELEMAFKAVIDQWGEASRTHGITMTGEMADCFASRREGVLAIAKVAQSHLQGKLLFYAGPKSLIPMEQLDIDWTSVASLNWYASVEWMASKIDDALIIDIGSTTTDILTIHQGKPAINGFNDADRLALGELLYMGVIRTPLMALTNQIEFEHRRINIAAEYFATVADVFRLTQEISEQDDLGKTADGMGKSIPESARRLARMIGCDSDQEDLTHWGKLAQAFKRIIMHRLIQSAQDKLGELPSEAKILGMGQGRFLVKQLAQYLNRDYIDVESMILVDHPRLKANATNAFPAYALAMKAFKDVA